MQVVENIKRLRKERNWSQTELAKRIDAHLSHLNRIENGKYAPTLDTVIAISNAFGVSIDYLVNSTNGSQEETSIKNKTFAEKIRLLNTLDETAQNVIVEVIDAFLTKKKMLDVLVKNE